MAWIGWQRKELEARCKGDPAKLAIAERLRKQTTLSIRDRAVRVQSGSSRSATARLHRWPRDGAATN